MQSKVPYIAIRTQTCCCFKTTKTKRADMSDQENKKWYENTGLVLFLIIIFPPVGLYIIWKTLDVERSTKWYIIIVFTALVIVLYFLIH